MPVTPSHSPRAERARIPVEYGVSKDATLVPWAHVEDRLRRDRVYWVTTISSGGRPRVRPVDGLYVDGVIYVGGSPETGWVRDIAGNPRVSVNLADVADVVIIDGDAEIMKGLDSELAEQVAAASNKKFPEYGMTAASYAGPGPIAITPRKVIAWTDFMKDPTRFTFDD